MLTNTHTQPPAEEIEVAIITPAQIAGVCALRAAAQTMVEELEFHFNDSDMAGGECADCQAALENLRTALAAM